MWALISAVFFWGAFWDTCGKDIEADESEILRNCSLCAALHRKRLISLGIDISIIDKSINESSDAVMYVKPER